MTQTDIVVIDAFLFLFVFMTAHSREINIFPTILIVMAGFLLGMTPFGYPVWWTFQAIGNALLG
ncbi:hypothetical protein ACFWY6_01835 [Streptomyces sp. NPDC059037]|uniref:hypothetical protein n=1 Tax=Streptomyces sp. NPDC059037 TaxID=3346710 RepID=UPI0036A054A0